MLIDELWQKCVTAHEEYLASGVYLFGWHTRLSNEEYLSLKAAGFDPSSVKAYPDSGVDMHKQMGEFQSIPGRTDRVKKGPSEKVARYGFYKVVHINGNIMQCYYSLTSPKDFVEELVEIQKSNLYAYNSIGSKNIEVSPGLIIYVYEPTELIEYMYNGRLTKAWQVKWKFVTEDYEVN